jgi:hypothetical protein
MLVYFMVNWNILRLFGIYYSHLVYIVVIWYVFSLFGIWYQEQSGNPGGCTLVRDRDDRSRFCYIDSIIAIFNGAKVML